MGANFIPTYRIAFLSPLFLLVTGFWGFVFTLSGIFLVVKTWKFGPQKTLIPYMMMLFSLFSAAATSFGRVEAGLQLALLSRYHIFQMFYFVGFFWLLIAYLIEINLFEKFCRFFAVLFVLLFLINWAGGIAIGVIRLNKYNPIAIELKAKAENSRADLLQMICVDVNLLRPKIKIIREMGYNIFRRRAFIQKLQSF